LKREGLAVPDRPAAEQPVMWRCCFFRATWSGKLPCAGVVEFAYRLQQAIFVQTALVQEQRSIAVRNEAIGQPKLERGNTPSRAR
jgi:hypothetical protein